MAQIIKVKYLPHAQDKLYRSSPNSVGYDLYPSCDFIIDGNEVKKIHTGVILEMPNTIFAQISEKSGNALKYGLTCRAGVIDPDYRGEVFVILQNTTNKKIQWDKTTPIAQLVFHNTVNIHLTENNTIDTNTYRGALGFGECTALSHRF